MARRRTKQRKGRGQSVEDMFNDVFDFLGDLEEDFGNEFVSRVKRRTPVDTGTARDSFFWDAGGMYTTDDLQKIEALEYGWSKQAPAGMIRVTLEEAEDIFGSVSEEFT